MKTISRLAALAAAAVTLALWPGLAGAHSKHADNGLHCGRGHAKHTRAIGRHCDRSGKHHGSGPTDATGPTGPTGAEKKHGNSVHGNSSHADPGSHTTA